MKGFAFDFDSPGDISRQDYFCASTPTKNRKK